MRKSAFNAVIMVGLVWTGTRAVPQSPVRVEWDGERLSVSAEGAPFSRILKEVAAKTGIRFRRLERLQDRVSVHLSNLELGSALPQLLSGFDYAIVGDASRPRQPSPTVVIIFGQHTALERSARHAGNPQFELQPDSASAPDCEGWDCAEAVESKVEPSRSGVETNPEKRLADLMKSARQGDAGALWEGVRDPDPTVQASAFEALAAQDRDGAVEALLSALKSDQPATRLEALQLLDYAKADERTTLPALRDALNDDDPNVRTYAVQALANRGGPIAASELREALHDADPSFRLTVVSTVAQMEEGIPLLREALSDPDESVSNSAALLLQEGQSKKR